METKDGSGTGAGTGSVTAEEPENEAAAAGEPGGGMSLMARQPLAVRPCSLAASLDVLGERWSLLAIREMGYGVHRFGRIAGYTGASRDILADRLRKLEAAGVIERRQYSEHPPRYEYHLTEAGRELHPVLLSLFQWGDKWAVEEPALTLRHTCGHRLEVDHVCRHCGGPVGRGTVEARVSRGQDTP
ncbi:helix-turn-helix domain-containing protein [Streptomyces sp. NPDC006638]|uniref:winged helix-turn-helix transcriptional regulator n=1 Tax=Streptomyces sp. NPDC006638 TaxID=3157183 RepID=UPI0033A4F939